MTREHNQSRTVRSAALGMRWEGLSSMLKSSVISNTKRVRARGVKGNLKGEGRLLGGLLVVGTGDSGVAFEHREAVSSHNVDWLRVGEAHGYSSEIYRWRWEWPTACSSAAVQEIGCSLGKQLKHAIAGQLFGYKYKQGTLKRYTCVCFDP